MNAPPRHLAVRFTEHTAWMACSTPNGRQRYAKRGQGMYRYTTARRSPTHPVTCPDCLASDAYADEFVGQEERF